MKNILGACLLFATLVVPAKAEELRVVTSIKPVHSLVASVMAGVGVPHLLVKGGASAHTYSMKPSDAEALQDAELIFWVGHDMETFLRGPLKTLAADADVITLAEAPDLITHAFREGGAFEAHDHEHEEEHEEAHEHEDEHEHEEEHDDADHADEHHDEHDDDEHHDDEHNEIDMHLWLDPVNAKAMLRQIEQALTTADPANAAQYAQNASKTATALDGLIAEVEVTLAPVNTEPFIVFHDAYQYFEGRFHITAVGSITVSPDVIPGVRRLTEIRQTIKQLDAVCVFSEPQFEPKHVALAIEGTNAKSGVLDPLGADLKAGPELYFTLIRNMAKALRECLSA